MHLHEARCGLPPQRAFQASSLVTLSEDVYSVVAPSFGSYGHSLGWTECSFLPSLLQHVNQPVGNQTCQTLRITKEFPITNHISAEPKVAQWPFIDHDRHTATSRACSFGFSQARP